MEKQFETFAKISTYAQRLWDFFRGLFRVSFSAIFDLFKIEEKCSSYINALTAVLYASTPIQGCDTWVIILSKLYKSLKQEGSYGL